MSEDEFVPKSEYNKLLSNLNRLKTVVEDKRYFIEAGFIEYDEFALGQHSALKWVLDRIEDVKEKREEK